MRARVEEEPQRTGREREPAPRPPPAGVLALQSSAGNAAVARLLVARQPKTADPPVAVGFPWPGEIDTPYNAALRKTPAKDADDPHANTVADLPKGTRVTVTGQERGWLKVDVVLDGQALGGYVSHELVKRTPVLDFTDEPDVIIGGMTVARALVSLKRAETKRAADPKWTPQSPTKELIEESTKAVEATGKYDVDPASYRVSFKAPAAGGKIVVSTIEDFILFVEAVEREYASATPREVAGEIRQIWFSDENWDVLLDIPGIRKGVNAEDI